MEEKEKTSIFDEYPDLYKLTSKTVDEHIEFYRNKKSTSVGELFTLWRRLSAMSETFDKRDWTENWYNWHKNIHAFEKHQFEARYLIENYLTDVLEELIAKIITKFENGTKLMIEKAEKKPQSQSSDIIELIKNEVKRQVKLELSNQKKKSKRKSQLKPTKKMN